MVPPPQTRNRRWGGFTLVELMIVLLLIALIASMAIPEFTNMVIRTKQSERDITMRAIQAAMVELIAQNEKFPNDLGSGASEILCDYDPPLPITGAKKQWVRGQPGWSSISWEPTSFVYFHYFAYGYSSPGLSYFYVIAASDLNANGIPGYKETWWQRDTSGIWNIWLDIEFPPGET